MGNREGNGRIKISWSFWGTSALGTMNKSIDRKEIVKTINSCPMIIVRLGSIDVGGGV